MTLRSRTASLSAAMVAVTAMIVAIGSPVAADPPVVVAQVDTADYSVELTTSGDGSIEADIHNKTAATISFGLGATLHEVRHDRAGVDGPVGSASRLRERGRRRRRHLPGIDPFVERDGHQRAARPRYDPRFVLDYRIPGRWFGLDVQSVSATAFSLQFGSR